MSGFCRGVRKFGIGLALLISGCASAPALTAWNPDVMVAAARAVEADTTLLADDERLLEAALAHLHPHSPVHDPARAAELLERLRDHPAGPRYSALLSHLIPLAAEAERARAEFERERALVAELRAGIDDYREIAVMADEARDASEARIAELTAAVERLQNVVAARDARILEIEEQLRGLMDIDLAGPPSEPGPP